MMSTKSNKSHVRPRKLNIDNTNVKVRYSIEDKKRLVKEVQERINITKNVAQACK